MEYVPGAGLTQVAVQVDVAVVLLDHWVHEAVKADPLVPEKLACGVAVPIAFT